MGSILLLNEIFILNYEAVIITGFFIVLNFLIKNLRPFFLNFFENTKENISSEINIILKERIAIISKNIAFQNRLWEKMFFFRFGSDEMDYFLDFDSKLNPQTK